MLCAKCHQKEATVHFRAVVDGTEQEAVHLCNDCSPDTAFNLGTLDLKQIEALSALGKNCEFCGQDAFSGQVSSSGGAIYWCFDCGMQFGRILSDLLVAQRPDLLNPSKEESSFFSFCSAPEIRTSLEAASQKAIQILKERTDRRDKGT